MLRSSMSQFMTPGELLAKFGSKRPVHAEYQSAVLGKSEHINSVLERSGWLPNPVQVELATKKGFSNWIDFQKTAVCPLCARQGYTPVTHDFKLIRTCSAHKILLTTHCNDCNQPVNANRPQLDHCRCGKPFTVSREAKEREIYEAVLLEGWIHGHQLTLLQAYSECLTLLVNRYGFRTYDPKLIEQFLSGDEQALTPLVNRLVTRFPQLPIRALLAPMACAKSELLQTLSFRLLNIYRFEPANKKRKFDKTFWLNLKEFRFALGLQTRLTKTIESQHFGISLHAGPSTCRFSQSQLIEFYQHFLPQKEITETVSPLTGLSAATKDAIDTLLLDIIAGKYTVASYDGRKPLDQLQVYTTAPISTSVPQGYLTINETALYLNTSWEIVRNLRINGLLPATHQKNFNNRYLILKSDVETFNNDYVTSNELSRQYGRTSAHLLKRLLNAGVKPVSGPSIDECVVNIFSRQEVKVLDSNHLVSAKALEDEQQETCITNFLDNSTWMTADDTARELGILVNQLESITKPELLISARPQNHYQHDKFYRRDSIQYAKLFLTTLEKVEYLAQELRTQPIKLLRRFKHLLKERTYSFFGDSFFSTSQAESLRLHYQHYWDAGTAARHLGCSRGQILTWRRSGKIEAVGEADPGFIQSPILFKATAIRAIAFQLVETEAFHQASASREAPQEAFIGANHQCTP